MSFARVAATAGRRAMSIGNAAANPYKTPKVPPVQAEKLQRQAIKLGESRRSRVWCKL